MSSDTVSTRIDGFTLIEILVALAVLAVAVTAVVASVSGHVRNAGYLQDRTLAHWVAMNRIVELHVSGDWPAPGTQQGDSLMAGHTWSWETAVSTTEDPDVRRVDINVYANRDAKSPLETMVAYVGRPPAGSASGQKKP